MPKETCPHCGAAMTEYVHSLTPGLVKSLVKFGEAISCKGTNDIHLQTEVDLTKNEYNNFQKLRYWGLVHHVDKSNIKSGRWLLTKLGGQFLRNEIGMPKKVKTFRNKKIAQWDTTISIKDFDVDLSEDYWQTDFYTE